MANFLMLLCGVSVSTFGISAPKPFIVVIDPGHGGMDEGTRFEEGSVKLSEKQVTLWIAQEVATQLKSLGIHAVLTRNEDKDVPLTERTALANRLKANAFLSIHMNSTPKSLHQSPGGPEGIETYILNHTTDASSKRLAELENAVLSGTSPVGDSANVPGNSDVALILKDLRLDANLTPSKNLACSLQKHLSPMSKDRGVRQALFYVLLGSDMPSVLIEAGFLTNARDRERVSTPEGRHAIAVSIAKAINEFRKKKLTNCQIH